MATLRDLVNALGSQAEAARRIGVSQPAVNGWVNGRSFPTPLAQRAIAAATGRPVEEIRALVDTERAARGTSPAPAAVGPVAEGA
jgi:DNA-binding transcriptional regulator YdaS (Cro superfamily)